MMSSGYHDSSPSHMGVSGSSSSSFAGAQEAIDLDPSTAGSFLSGDPKKHDDLKQMLDSSKESLKLEAMKRIIGMVARGRDVGDLFPAVVKNVVSKNIEIKKLVYVYLTRYAEEQQDVALLSISTFQRALKDPNQLIRASALRVLSSIRVPVIVPIVMLAIRDSAVDMSPFVRKTAAHAIPKAYSIDPDLKDELVGIIEKLLGDRTTLVVGSAVMAFEEVCPQRTDLIHKQFRKLCHLLVDVEEWGQVIIVNMLLRYARTQFVDPNPEGVDMEEEDEELNFYGDSDDERKGEKNKKKEALDQDHRLLLKSAKPLLQSRNAAVVMATAQLYHHCAPKNEVHVVAKAMIRLLRSHTEVQALVLNCIASMTSNQEGKARHNMFEPHLKNFFVRSVDPSHVKILKLEIMTNLATESNIGILLREFQSYITGQDKVCVAATIQAIGRCAATIDEVTDTCLNGLVQLLSNRDQAVVAESVVVIKKLLQTQSGDHGEIIIHMAKLMDTIKVPAARAAILWVLGEYSERVPKVAPDVLRKMAKSFTSEDTHVKVQVLNLATKLVLTNPEQTELLSQYVFNLAKYDKDYDLRDRARFMRAFVFNNNENNALLKHAKKIFLAPKPAPVTNSRFKDRDVYQIGSMSHFLNQRAPGYQDLPDYPEVAPDPTVRNVEPPKAPNTWEKTLKKKAEKEKKKGFYSDSESSSSSSGSGSGSESASGSESDSESESEDENPPNVNGQKNKLLVEEKKEVNSSTLPKKQEESESSDSDSSSSSGSDSDSGSDSKSSEDEKPVKKPSPLPKKEIRKGQTKETKKVEKKTNLDLLLGLDDDIPPNMSPTTIGGGILTPSIGGMLSPSDGKESPIGEAKPSFVSTKTSELLNKIATGGLQVEYRYTRSSHLYSPIMVNIELTFSNLGSSSFTELRVGGRTLAQGMSIHEFPEIRSLEPNQTKVVNLGINFNDTTQNATLDIVANDENGGSRCHKVTIPSTVGEQIKPISIPEATFTTEQKKLRGMNEVTASFNVPSNNSDEGSLKKRVFEAANLAQVPSVGDGDDGIWLRFAGKTLVTKSLVLVTLSKGMADNMAKLTVNCEKIVLTSLLCKNIQSAIQ